MTGSRKGAPDSQRMKAIAFHEAGHAVAGWDQQIALGTASIVPRDQDNSLGHCQVRRPQWFRPDVTIDRRTESWIERRIIVLFAEQSAERLARGRANHVGATADRQAAEGLARELFPEDAVRAAYLKWLRLGAGTLVTQSLNRAAIGAVAAELIKRQSLRSGEVKQIILDGIDG
jgi:ATP-dependent Zn protease